MAVVELQKRSRVFGPESAGTLMTPREFDTGDFEEGWVYELINGVLVVSPIPLEQEADPNEELGHLLRAYKETHPQGSALDKTLGERIIRTGKNRRRGDRLIWAGLGRLPRRTEKPSIIAEFVSKGKRDRRRDYVVKKGEYRRIRVKEYWIIDRFERTMTVFFFTNGKTRKHVVHAHQTYETPLLPGFILPLNRLFTLADQWDKIESEEE